MKPLLYDVFCGAGGCTRGYQMAGFRVVGIDNRPQRRYVGDAFLQMDALEFLRRLAAGEYERPAAVHCSPPCQGYSRMRHLPWLKGKTWPLLIDPVRELLLEIGVPWVIENVEDAPLQGITLCGTHFGLKVYRHRRFESSEFMLQLPHLSHQVTIGRGRMLNARQAGENEDGWMSVCHGGRARTQKAGPPVVRQPRRDVSKGTLNAPLAAPGLVTVAGHQTPTKIAGAAMGIDWMTRDELCQAIPPAYCEWIGTQLMAGLCASQQRN